MTESPINRLLEEDELLARLWLNATDAARVCGVTVRQLTYWTDKGIIPSHDASARSYDIAALRKVIAIKRAMVTGYTLEKATQLLEDRASDAGAAERESGADEAAESVGAYLDGLVATVRAYRQALPACLALAALRRTLERLACGNVEHYLAGCPDRAAAAHELAAPLNEAVAWVEQARAIVEGPTVAGPLSTPATAPDTSVAYSLAQVSEP